MEQPGRKTEGYIYPKDFFEKNKTTTVSGLCFVMMPFEPKMAEVYDTIAKALAESRFRAVRADQVFDTKPIMISIMEKINEAELIIADVTGRNANVFYELGMAHILKDSVILITQDVGDVPFDLRHFRHIIYQPSSEGTAKLRQSLLETLSAIGLRRKSTPTPTATPTPAPTPTPRPISTPVPTTGTVFTYSGTGIMNTPPFEIGSSPWKLRYMANWDGHFAVQVRGGRRSIQLVVNKGVSAGKVYDDYVYDSTGSLYFFIQNAPDNGNWTLSVVAES